MDFLMATDSSSTMAPREPRAGRDPGSSTIQRQVRDGRRFRAVKVALEPRTLERSLRELGWVIEVKPLAGPFFLGLGGRAD